MQQDHVTFPCNNLPAKGMESTELDELCEILLGNEFTRQLVNEIRLQEESLEREKPKSEEYSDDVESQNRLAQDIAEWRRRLANEFPIVELQREIHKTNEASHSQVCKELRDRIDSELKTIPVFNSAAWKRRIENESVMLEERIKRKNTLELEKDNEKFVKKEESNALELEEKNSDFVQSHDIRDENRVAENAVPLMTEETVNIDLREYENSTSPAHRRIMQTHVNKHWDIKKMGILLLVGIPSSVCIAMITFGSLYLNDCPAQPYIPIYLVVGGSFSMFFILIGYSCQNSTDRCVVYFVHLLNVNQFVWLIVGCVWVYSVKEVEFDDTTKDEYCHKTLYYFAFWLMNISLGLLSLVVIPLLCCCLFNACVSVYKKMKRPILPPGYG